MANNTSNNRLPGAARPGVVGGAGTQKSMMRLKSGLCGAAVILAAIVVTGPGLQAAAPAPKYLSPGALTASPDGSRLYVAFQTASQVGVFDLAAGKLAKTFETPGVPAGLAVSKDGARLYVTCAAPQSTVVVFDTATGAVQERIPAGHTAMAPVLSPDGRTLYVCNRFDNDVSVVDLASKKTTARIPVQREPMSAALTPDGKWLLAANSLHTGIADAEVVSAVISVIDTAAGKVAKELVLPNGSGLLRDIKISPSGKIAAVTHILARFRLPTTQLERGWMNTDALSLIDLAQMKVINTVLLDNVDSGAANPWGIAWSADERQIVVAHAGTHEISVIDAPGLLDKLAKMPATLPANQTPDYTKASHVADDVPNDLSFLVGVRRRIKLAPENGPRSVVIVGSRAYTGNYFSDTLSSVDVTSEYPKPLSLALGAKQELSLLRKGEMYFNDAGICFQGWQSCASCHGEDARVDALNWDLLNDGIGNPKNNKSMLLAHKTPPSMSQGVRETGEQAVRAGIRHILFTVQPDEIPAAMDEYLKALKPVPSPALEKGKLSAAAARGKKLFEDDKVGCAKCHPMPLFTDLNTYDVGTKGQYDRVGGFDTPTLVECWRTGPYLHDGSVVSIRDLFTKRNKDDVHGTTSHLTPQQLDELVAYVKSL